MSEETDENLMLLYGSGDAAAFEVVYQRHKGPLYRYMSRLSNRAPVLDELYQEVWLSVIEAHQRYRPTAKFKTYLYQIAHNKIIDYFRRSATQPVDNSREEADLEKIHDTTQLDPERIVHNKACMEKLLQLIPQLPKPQREVFLLKEEAGMSLPEIADVTEQNLEAVKSRLRYALAKLRSGLKGFVA